MYIYICVCVCRICKTTIYPNPHSKYLMSRSF